MKTKKIILAISVAMAILLALFCGCSDAISTQTNTTQENDVVTQTPDKVISDCIVVIPLTITSNNETNLSDELIKHVKAARTAGRGEEIIADETGSLYSLNKISDINKFYNIESLKIDEYKLYNLEISSGVFNYLFLPTGRTAGENNILDNQDAIRVSINYHSENPFSIKELWEFRIEQAVRDNSGYLTKDNMIYSEAYNDIVAQMGDALLYITAPFGIADYEFLRDLAFQVIETEPLNVNEAITLAENADVAGITE